MAGLIAQDASLFFREPYLDASLVTRKFTGQTTNVFIVLIDDWSGHSEAPSTLTRLGGTEVLSLSK